MMALKSDNNLHSGAAYLFHGFALIFKPGLKRFLIIPLIINVLLFVGLFFLTQHYLSLFNHWMDSHLPTWLHWLNFLVWLIFMAGFVLTVVYTFVTLSNILCLPFNSLLSEQVQIYLTGKSPIKKNIWEFIQDLPRLLGRQLAVMGYFIPRAVFLLILFLVPLVQMIAGLLWLAFNAWMMTLQHIDYPMDNNQVPFKDLRRLMSQNYRLSMGFGAGFLLLSVIPVVNLLLIPAAVAGATELWVNEYSE
jgi:CysZ protein